MEYTSIPFTISDVNNINSAKNIFSNYLKIPNTNTKSINSQIIDENNPNIHK